MECVFCRIVAGEIPAAVVRETDVGMVIRDVNPQAPVHLLVMPKSHVKDLDDAVEMDEGLLVAQLMRLASEAARAEGLNRDGYRVVANTGRHGGQTVAHLHLHVLGGRPMTWPPG